MAILQSISPAAVVLAILAAAGAYYILREVLRWVRWRPHRRSGPEPLRFRRSSSGDSADQLRTVMRARFSRKKVMNLNEYKVFKAVETEVQSLNGGHRVFAQTSLGEVLETESWAHPTINSKRVDVLVIGPSGLPVVAVEYQGGGHYQGDAAARDAVKKEALRRAGVTYVEISNAEDSERTRRAVREAMNATGRATTGRTMPAVGSRGARGQALEG